LDEVSTPSQPGFGSYGTENRGIFLADLAPERKIGDCLRRAWEMGYGSK
jgi:hypothetical protein